MKLIDIALSQYLEYKCQICGCEYKNLEQLRSANPICVNSNPVKLACKVCWNNKD